MNWHDDRLDALIRSADPARTPADAPLTVAEHATLDRILAGSPPKAPTPRRRRTWAIALTPIVAALAVIAVVVGINVFTPAPSYAATPPMLAVTGPAQDAPLLLTRLAAQLRSSPAAENSDAADQTIRVHTWALVINADTPAPSYVAPDDRTIVIGADGSFSQTATAGAAYDGAGQPVTPADLPAPGTELWSEKSAPGEHTFMFPAELPTTGPELHDLIAKAGALTDTATGSDWVSMIVAILLEQDPTDAEQAAILDVLSELGVTSPGTTTDRLGRPATVLELPGAPGFTEQLLIDSSGQIIASESISTRHDRADIPSPAVTSYFAWERN